MFGYTELELLESFMQYPKFYRISLSKMMQFVFLSALPLLNEQEKKEMDIVKQKYDKLLIDLASTVEHKKKIAATCLQLLYKAVNLYDQSFNRIANSYFGNVYN